MLEEKLNSVEFENQLFRKIGEAESSRRQVKNRTEIILDYQNFIALVANIFTKESNKAVDIESDREERRQKLIEAA